MTSRNKVLDALKLFAIFLVIWGHCVQHLLSTEPSTEPLYRIIYSFHMPLFMAMVGFFSNSLLRLNFKELLVKRGERLLLPALTAGLLAGVIIFCIEGKNEFLSQIFYGLWFLKSAFVCAVLFYVCHRFLPGRWLWVVVSLALSQMTLFYKVGIMYPFFLLGLLMSRRYTDLQRNAGVIAFVTGVVFVCLNILCKEYILAPHKALLRTVFTEAFAQTAFLVSVKLVVGLSGVLFFSSLFEFLSRYVRFGKTGDKLCGLGRETLGVYILQTFILEIVMRHYISFDGYSTILAQYVFMPLISVVLLLLCVALINLLKRNRYIAFMLFGINPKACP